MARRNSSSSGFKPWQFIVIIMLALGIYGYKEGFFNDLLGRFGLPTITTSPEPTSRPSNSTSSTNPNNQTTTLPRAKSVAAAINPDKAFVATGSWYQVFFTRPAYPEKAANRQGGIDAAMIVDIDAAKTSIKVASFDFDLDSLTEALVRAKQRGVDVQMVIDDENLPDVNVARNTGTLEQNGIPITWDRRSAFMHNKILIIDDKVVWTGSMNFVNTDAYRNNNNMLRFNAPDLVKNYVSRFEHLFAGDMGGKAPADTPFPVVELNNGVTIETYFSPSDKGRPRIVDYLKSAQKSVKMLAFSYTDSVVAGELLQMHKAGMSDIRIIQEARNVEGTGSKFNTMKNAGISILPDANCYILHNKVIIIDDAVVITGSYNFTRAAEDSNDENFLIIIDPTLAKYYSDEFERLWDQASNPPRCGN